jgi:hypothetical protein
MRGAHRAPLIVSTRRQRETESSQHNTRTEVTVMANSTNSRIQQIAKVRCRGIINFCQQPDVFLLKEVRGSQIRYFLMPSGLSVRAKYAAEAIASGFLTPRDRDLFNEAMSWVYAPAAPKTFPQFPQPAITARKTDPR